MGRGEGRQGPGDGATPERSPYAGGDRSLEASGGGLEGSSADSLTFQRRSCAHPSAGSDAGGPSAARDPIFGFVFH